MQTNWLLLIVSLPTENATVRMRAWRSLKTVGAAVLRDGVYLLPTLPTCSVEFERIAADVNAAGGMALYTQVFEPESVRFASWFDRSQDYALLSQEATQFRQQLTTESADNYLKSLRKLRKQHAQIAAIDFFPGDAQLQSQRLLDGLELAAKRLMFPNEPQFAVGEIALRELKNYRGKIWATRRRPWVDRLASAWLIKRFIDPEANILWLESPSDCPPDALGFDFDGAEFTHVGERVTFEVLLASFGLGTPGLDRMAALVHYLDVGGNPPPEAVGVENLLAGLRDSISDDDLLLANASIIFDGLLANFDKANAHA